MKIVGDDGQELPWDGKRPASCMVRGPWVVDRYFKGEGGDRSSRAKATAGFQPATWRRSIASGFMQITDRTKDVIKSGGEWISSIDLENIAMAHPCVQRRRASPRRIRSGTSGRCSSSSRSRTAELTREELLAFYEGHIAKWWMPDDVVFVDAIPLGATGKMLKNRLREQYGRHLLEKS